MDTTKLVETVAQVASQLVDTATDAPFLRAEAAAFAALEEATAKRIEMERRLADYRTRLDRYLADQQRKVSDAVEAVAGDNGRTA